MKKILKRVMMVLLVALQAGAARAANEAFELFEEEEKVVTASRRTELLTEAPSNVAVITEQ